LVNTFSGANAIDTSSTMKMQADTFNALVSPTSTRDSGKVNEPIKLTLSFQSTNPIPKGALIKFYIPTDQAVLDGNAISVRDPVNPASVIAVKAGLATGVTPYLTFSVTEWCSDENSGKDCPASYTSTIEVTKGFKNPANARFPTNSIKIEVYTATGDFKVDAVSASLLTIPSCNYGTLQSVQVSRSSNLVGQPTTATFTFKTAAGTPGDLPTSQGFVNILFPAGFLYVRSSVTTPTCTVKDTSSSAAAASTTCTPTLVTDSLD
jgi:hypothetical protein